MSLKQKIGIMERRRALETARNMLYSKVGKMVLEGNQFPDRTLELNKRLIDGESKKCASLIENDKKMFKRDRLIYNLDPTILIERPASPVKSAAEGSDEEPHYMRPIKNVSDRPPIETDEPVLDAFIIKKRKKRNLWEPERGDDTNIKFRSIIMQSPPLIEEETKGLETTYLSYRPGSSNEAALRTRLIAKQEEKKAILQDQERSNSPDPQEIFITQLERQAQSRSTSRTKSSKLSAETSKSLQFNPFHLEAFETIRKRQKMKAFAHIKGL